MKNNCSFDGCDRPKRGQQPYCTAHYRQKIRGKDLTPLRGVKKPEQCSVGVCSREARVKSLCKGHYRRLQRGAPLDVEIFDKPAKNKKCTSDGCEKPHVAKGLCRGHYSRARRGQDTQHPLAKSDAQLYCHIENCNRPHDSRGFCSQHAKRDRKGLDKSAEIKKTTKREKKEWYIDGGGYLSRPIRSETTTTGWKTTGSF